MGAIMKVNLKMVKLMVMVFVNGNTVEIVILENFASMLY